MEKGSRARKLKNVQNMARLREELPRGMSRRFEKSYYCHFFSCTKHEFQLRSRAMSIDVHVASAIITLGFLGCNTLSKWNVGHLLFSTKITHTHAHFWKKKLWCSTPIADNGNLKFGGVAARKASSLRGCRHIVFRCISLLCVFLFVFFKKNLFVDSILA